MRGGRAPGFHIVNDVHSQLNPTRVRQVQKPHSIESLQQTIASAERDGLAIAVAGSRHAMGGQQFAAQGCLIDTRGMSQVLSFDAETGTVDVEAGIEWPELLQWLIDHQSDQTGIWTIAQKQTGADRLTIGGALAANIHGRGLSMRPFIGDIESFVLVDAAGRARRCSRTENRQLFQLAIGGYGLFGPVYSVRLRLVRRRKLRREVRIIQLDELPDAFEQRIAEGFTYGDFQFAIDRTSDDFLTRGVFSCYRPISDDVPMPPKRKLSLQNWNDLVYLAHADPSRAFREYANYYLSTSGQIYWSDLHQFSNYLLNYHGPLDHRLKSTHRATEIITEIYVPKESLVSFMQEARDYIRAQKIPLIYGTVRRIERDDESFLAWAKRSYLSVIFNLCTAHTPEGIARSAAAFRHLIDLAIARNGSYYLTYHRFARPDQVLACYPQFSEFLRAKSEFDPQDRFQSDWLRHMRRMAHA